MNNWQKVRLKDVVSILGDGLHGTPKYDESGEYFFINGNNLSDGQIKIKSDTKRVNVSEYLKHKKDLNDRTLLVSINGTIGNVATYKGEKCILGKSACYFNILPGVCKEYIYYILLHDNFQSYAKKWATGTTIKNVSLKQMREYEFLLPSFEKQQQIAKILSSLDDKIELNTQINHNLEEQAKAILDQNCLAHKTLKVGDIVSFANGFAFKSSTYIEKGKFKVVTIKNVQDGKIDTSSADCVHEIPAKMKAECILNIGDVLLSLTGNVGRTGIVCENNLLLNQRVAKIIPHQSVLNAVCYFIFRRPEMKATLETIARGTAQANLSPVETLDIEIPFDIPTLQDIALCMKSFFEQIISNEMEIQKLAQLRDTLLPKLMSGELDVSEVEV